MLKRAGSSHRLNYGLPLSLEALYARSGLAKATGKRHIKKVQIAFPRARKIRSHSSWSGAPKNLHYGTPCPWRYPK
jgi:hypothetical protein